MKETRKAHGGNGLRIADPPFDPPVIHDACNTDPDLTAIAHAWSTLPEALKAGIVAMVKAASGK